jgi:hypothetical protein
MNVGIYIEGQEGVTWDDWRRLARRAEQVQRLRKTRIDHVFFQVFDYTDLAALTLLAETVMPALRA